MKKKKKKVEPTETFKRHGFLAIAKKSAMLQSRNFYFFFLNFKKNETKKLLVSGVVPVRAVTFAVKSFPLDFSTALSF